jgi:hypothetical protein
MEGVESPEPTRDRPRSNEPAAVGPRRRGTKRPRRDQVSYVAVGLLVALALTIVSRLTTAPEGHPPRRDPRPTLRSARGRTASTHRSVHDVAPPKSDVDRIARSERSISDDPTRAAISTTTKGAPSIPTTSTTPTPETTTTISPAPSPTTTTPPPSLTTADGPLEYSGVLSYPEDIATSIPFSSESGVAAVRVTWRGGGELVASLRCPGAEDSAPGAHGISISIDGSPGTCAVAIALGSGVRARVAYTGSGLAPGPRG